MNSDFAAVKAFHFVNHSWNQFNGVHFDASTHVFNFQTKLQLYWCFLEGIGGIGGTFLVKAIFDTTIVIPGNPPYYCLSIPIMKQHLINFPVASGTEISVNFLNTLPSTSGAGGWSNYLLVSRDAIPNNFRAHTTVRMWRGFQGDVRFRYREKVKQLGAIRVCTRQRKITSPDDDSNACLPNPFKTTRSWHASTTSSLGIARRAAPRVQPSSASR